VRKSSTPCSRQLPAAGPTPQHGTPGRSSPAACTARAARNRAQGTAASLRLALLLGTAIFLSVSIDFFVVMPLAGPGQAAHPWLAAAACALSTAAGLAPWLWSRAVTVTLVISAGVLLAVGLGAASGDALSRGDVRWLAWILVAMGALVALSGGPSRLPGSWLWLLGPLSGSASSYCY
jgi:hypothetical protein